MNFSLTEEQALLQRTVREFAENEVKPHAREIDENGHFPRETFRKAAELGSEDKAIIFTESRRTQDYLVRLLFEPGRQPFDHGVDHRLARFGRGAGGRLGGGSNRACRGHAHGLRRGLRRRLESGRRSGRWSG